MNDHDESDEFQLPDDEVCHDCEEPWSRHQGGDNGVTAPRTGCEAFNYVPPGWR